MSRGVAPSRQAGAAAPRRRTQEAFGHPDDSAGIRAAQRDGSQGPEACGQAACASEARHGAETVVS